MSQRTLLRIAGADHSAFMQGLITNDIARTGHGPIYAALLTPQGKYLADFFAIKGKDHLLIDADATQAAALIQRLNMYRLRADVQISHTQAHLHRGLGRAPQDAWADPRHEALGWRAWRDTPAPDETTDWDALYVQHCIPQSNIELNADTYILEAGFERLNGVDFRKGCYVGQEITARMKHKTTLRKGLACITIDRPAPVGTQITARGKPAGILYTQSANRAIAYLRYDRAQGTLEAAGAQITML